MSHAPRSIALSLLLLTWGLTSLAQDSDEATNPEKEQPSQTVTGEILVVTASRTEQPLHEAPVTISVLTSQQIEQIPSDDYGDLLRNIPGLNVSQISARDIQISGRTATSSLSTSELVLVDGRTLYLDFFGFVMWDFLPTNPREIKQIEVVRSPGSAVWGANAMGGVINLITKSPREIAGTSIQLGGGQLSTLFGSVTHAGASDKFGYKISGSYYEQDPYDRPSGTIPGTGTSYPPFPNQGTSQPKLDLRFDYDPATDATWSFGAGWAGTDGIIHSGIGPFDITDATMGYAKAEWLRQAARIGFFVNSLDGDADNLLTVGPDGRPIPLSFKTQTYNLDLSNSTLLGDSNVLTYGANARQNNFDLTIAPNGDDRTEYGVYLQDEIFLGQKLRWVVGARYDDLDPIGGVVSPRTSLIFSPSSAHTLRLSYSRAFRQPSLVNNYLDIVIVNRVLLPAIPPLLPQPSLFVFPSVVNGNVNLVEERLDAYEISYVGTFGRTTVTAAVYRNETTESIDFFTAAYYSSNNPPPGWPLPPFIPTPIGLLPTVPADTFPSLFSYRNVGELTDEGVELSVDSRISDEVSLFVNYSYQKDPEVSGIPKEETNIPAKNRANLGASWDNGTIYVNGNVNYVDEAFWTDVLDARFHGPTDSFTQVNLGLGWRATDRLTFSLSAQNVFDARVQQHVFGDIISRKVTAQLVFDIR